MTDFLIFKFFQYAVILLIFFILQVAIGIYGFIQLKDESNIKLKIEKDLNKFVTDYTNNKEVIDSLQKSVSITLYKNNNRRF